MDGGLGKLQPRVALCVGGLLISNSVVDIVVRYNIFRSLTTSVYIVM